LTWRKDICRNATRCKNLSNLIPSAPKGEKKTLQHLPAATFPPLYTLAAGPAEQPLPPPPPPLLFLAISEFSSQFPRPVPRDPPLIRGRPSSSNPSREGLYQSTHPPECCGGDLILSRPAGRIGPAVVGLIRGGVAVVLWLAGWWEER
jgi:hypothetical protein